MAPYANANIFRIGARVGTTPLDTLRALREAKDRTLCVIGIRRDEWRGFALGLTLLPRSGPEHIRDAALTDAGFAPILRARAAEDCSFGTW